MPPLVSLLSVPFAFTTQIVEFTVSPLIEPVKGVVLLSLMDTLCVPAVFSVTLNVYTPASPPLYVCELGVITALGSELVTVTVFVYPVAVLLYASSAVTVTLYAVPLFTGLGNGLLTDRLAAVPGVMVRFPGL